MDLRDSLVPIELHRRGALRVGLDRGIVSPFFQPSPVHDELVERVRIPFFSPLLCSILVDPGRCGLSPLLVWCLLLS